jgi:hypothetical protein
VLLKSAKIYGFGRACSVFRKTKTEQLYVISKFCQICQIVLVQKDRCCNDLLYIDLIEIQNKVLADLSEYDTMLIRENFASFDFEKVGHGMPCGRRSNLGSFELGAPDPTEVFLIDLFKFFQHQT